MTEHEWLECVDREAMLGFVERTSTARKMRLFAAACCRRVWTHLRDERSRRLVETAEAFADGAASIEQLRAALNRAADARKAIRWQGGDAVDQSAAEAVLGLRPQLSLSHVFEGIEVAVGEARAAEAWERIYDTPGKDHRTQEIELRQEYDAGAEAERAAQTDLLRDVFGNPFRPVRLDRRWLTSNVFILSRAIYAERAFERLPILADALMDAGCDDEDLLDHCRSDGPHVKGCWVVDLLLGKE